MTKGALSDRNEFKVGCPIAFINHHIRIGKSFNLVHTAIFLLLMPKNSPEHHCELGYNLLQTENVPHTAKNIFIHLF